MTDRERWNTGADPAWMLAVLGDAADERRMLLFSESMGWIADSVRGISLRWCINYALTHTDKTEEACQIIRCLWPSPFIERERVECENCKTLGTIVTGRERGGQYTHSQCQKCKGKGFTLAPLIEDRWRTPLVMDLARQVRGGDCACRGLRAETLDGRQFVCTRCNGKIKIEPNLELMPILADALMDWPACCDVPEIIEYLKCGVHVAGECWVVSEILEPTLIASGQLSVTL